MKINTLEKEASTNKLNGFSATDIGDDHLYTGLETPMKPDAFKLNDTEKKRAYSNSFRRNYGCYGIGFN